MTRTTRRKQPSYRDLYAFYRSFAKEEDGMVTIFACFMIFIMMMVAGIGVDMMRHEMERTRIQAVADRAVLAATDLDQEYGAVLGQDDNGDDIIYDAEYVVRDYFAKSGMSDYLQNVEVSPPAINSRTVTVEANAVVPTMFMDWFGTETLNVPAVSTAEETKNKVEISMVLDISGSMRHNNKMPNLRSAAGTFVDTVLTEQSRDLVSINVVPYTAQVNAGLEIFSQLDIEEQLHEWSYCVDFEDGDFQDTAIYFGEASVPDPYVHMQHFEAGYSWLGSYDNLTEDRITNPGCPKQSFEEIQAYSQTPSAIKANIDQFQPRANTSIHLGMKWGVAMLDPEWRKFNAVLPSVDEAFRGRPSDYSDDETIKTVILMTDGVNVTTRRITDQAYSSDAWRVYWSNMPLYGVLNRFNVNWNDYRYTKYTPSQADGLLEDICDAAKDQNIIIWSIGFEVEDHGANVMRDCASSPSHFFRVEGVEISEAFQSIARQINQLRLTQ